MINHLASAFLFVACVSGFANPSEPVVMADEASFHAPESHALHIHVNDQSIIHWKDFSIAQGEITKFIQPSADSMVLNRVIGDNLSEIFGRLESNGELLLINPNGILFGENAVVDTASFLASTLDLSDAAFLSKGGYLFQGSGKTPITRLSMPGTAM